VPSPFRFVVRSYYDEVHQDEDDEHCRDERDSDSSHLLLPLLLRPRVTSGLPSFLPWYIGE
jgi:hypothetical protein